MKVHVALLSVVTLLCAVAPVMANPIPISSSFGVEYPTVPNGRLVFSGSDLLSLRSPLLSNFGITQLPGNRLLTIPAVLGRGMELGGSSYPGPTAVPPPDPSPTAVPEPGGLMVMFGSGLFGVVAWVRRKLRARDRSILGSIPRSISPAIVIDKSVNVLGAHNQASARSSPQLLPVCGLSALD
jgi:hypothetical protein